MSDVRTVAPTTTPQPEPVDPAAVDQPPLVTTASIVAGGHAAWLGWLWLTIAVLFGVAIAVISAVGELDQSLWSNAVAGWQRWVIVGAGAATTASFLPMLVGNGVTRRRFAGSVLLGGGALILAATAFVVVGYLVEGAVYAANDWPHVLGADGDDPIEGVGTYLRIAADHLVTFAAYFVTGWIGGMLWHRSRALAAAAFLPALVPIATAEILLRGESGADVVDGWSFDPPLAVGLPVTAAVVAVACWVAARIALELEVRPGRGG